MSPGPNSWLTVKKRDSFDSSVTNPMSTPLVCQTRGVESLICSKNRFNHCLMLLNSCSRGCFFILPRSFSELLVQTQDSLAPPEPERKCLSITALHMTPYHGTSKRETVLTHKILIAKFLFAEIAQEWSFGINSFWRF